MKPNLLNKINKVTGAVDNNIPAFDGESGQLLKSTDISAQVLSDAVNNADTGAMHTTNVNIHVTKELKDIWNQTTTDLAQHITNQVIHVTAEEKQIWEAKETTAGAQAKANAVQTNLNVHMSNIGIHVTQSEKNRWNNTYTRNEVDNMMSSSVDGSEWKTAVATFGDLSTTYPEPMDGWKVTVQDEDIVYMFDPVKGWFAISSNSIPLATSTLEGKMSSTDKVKLDSVEFGANNYIHPDNITTRHITDDERTKWNNKASSAVATEYSNGLMAFGDKIKMNTVEMYANFYAHPETHPGTIIAEDSTHRFVTDLEKKIWNEKASTELASTTTSGLMSASDKSKLGTIAEYANRYIHPEKHDPSIISTDYLNRFVTDAQIVNWDNKETSEKAQLKADTALSAAKTYTDQKIEEVFSSAPELLNTFNEIAEALGNDPNFATTITNQLAKKIDESVYNTHVLNTDIHFSASERTKLNSIEEGANKYNHPTSHSANMIEQTETRNFVSIQEKTDWNNKASSSIATINTDGLMSANDKAKLDSIEPRAEENVQADWNSTDQENPAYIWNKPTFMMANGGDCDTIVGKSADDLMNAKKLATIIIGTKLNNHTDLDADYLCDGIIDYDIINDAIISLPESGGKIIFKDGTYNIKLPILVTKNNIILEGFGNSTKLVKDFDSSEESSPMIKVTGNNCTIRDMYLSSETFNTATNVILSLQSNGNIITNCTLVGGNSIYIYNGSYNKVKHNTFKSCANRGVYIRSEASNTQFNNVESNNFTDCVVGVSIASTNTYQAKNNNILGNNIYNCTCGIRLSNTAANNLNTCNNIISNNNIVRGNGLEYDYTETQYTINIVNATKNMISNNILNGKDIVDTTGLASNIKINNII
jgi:hypothetical protein